MRRLLSFVLFIALAGVFLAMLFPCRTAYAYESWVRDKSYETGETVGGDVISGGTSETLEAAGIPDATKGKPGVVQVKISEVLVEMANFVIYGMKNMKMDCSVTGVILGYITNGSGTSMFVFDLTDDNIYGMCGALIYIIMRTLALCFLFILTLKEVIGCIFMSDAEAYKELKQTLVNAFITFMFMFLMPQLVDWVCTARNSVAIFIYDNVVGSGVLGDGTSSDQVSAVFNLETEYYNIWKAHKSIPNALIYIMGCVIVPIVYIFSYFKIAIAQTMLFGAYPVFALVGFKNKATHSKWMGVFFTNAFVPVIDLVMLFIPAMVISRIDTEALASGFLKSVIVMAIFVSIVPVRDQLLRMLGNEFNIRPGSVGGALELAGAAIGAFKTAFGGIAGAVSDARGSDSAEGGAAGQSAETDASMSEMGRAADSPVEGSAAQKEQEDSEKTEEMSKDGTAANDDVSTLEENERIKAAEAEAENAMNQRMDMPGDQTEQSKEQSDLNAEELAKMSQEKAQMDQEQPERQTSQDQTATATSSDTSDQSVHQEQTGENQGQTTPESELKTGAGDNTMDTSAFNGDTSGDSETTSSEAGPGNTESSHEQNKMGENTSKAVNEDVKAPIITEPGHESEAETETKLTGSAEMNDAMDKNIEVEVPGLKDVTKDELSRKAEETLKNPDKETKDPITQRAADVLRASRGMDQRAAAGKAGKQAGFDPNRYENFNMNRLSNLETMGKHQQSMVKVEKSIMHERTAMAASNKAITENNRKIAEMKAGMTQQNLSKKERIAEIKKLEADTARHQEIISTSGSNIAQYNEARTVLQSNIAQCQTREAQFAQVMSDRGMAGGVPYQDAASFANEIKKMERAQSAASYKNFKVEAEKGFLTPEDRMKFERTENLHRMASGLGSAVGGLAGTAAGVAAAGAAVMVSAAAGEDSMRYTANRFGRSIVNSGEQAGEKIGGAVPDATVAGVKATVKGAKAVKTAFWDETEDFRSEGWSLDAAYKQRGRTPGTQNGVVV